MKSNPGKPEANASLGFAIVLALGLLIGMAYLWQHFSGGEDLPRGATVFAQLHPIMVHLPFALLLVVFAMEILSVIKPLRGLQANTRFLLWLATLGAAGSILGGFMLKTAGAPESGLLVEHMWTGFGVAAGCLAALMLKSGTGQSFLYRFVLTLTVLTLLVTTHLGVSITHQPDYLSKHMPDSWAIKPYLNLEGGLRGLVARWTGKAPEKPDAEAPLVYRDYVYPILEAKCTGCHNAEKTKGKLNMEDWAAFSQRGEEHDPAFVAGDPDASLMIERIRLPLDDEDHMPPEDKDQLTAEEIRVLTWWIQEGASPELAVADANLDDAIAAILEKMEPPDPAALAAEKAAAEKAAAEAEQKTADRQAALDALEEKGYSLRPLSAEDTGLQFNAVNVAAAFDDEALGLFESVAADMVELDLARTGITDASASILGRMENLTKLHLENTAITDATLAGLADLDKLEYLNLYGTGVTDAGLENLKELDSIRKIYAWETKVTPEGGKAFEDAVEGAEVNLGWKESDIPGAAAEDKTPAGEKPGGEEKSDATTEPDPPKPAPEKPKKNRPAAKNTEQGKPGTEKPGADKPGADKPGADKPARKAKAGAGKPVPPEPDPQPATPAPKPKS